MKKIIILAISIILLLGISVVCADDSSSSEPVQGVELIISGFFEDPSMTANMGTDMPDETKNWLLDLGDKYSTVGILNYKMDSNPEEISKIVMAPGDVNALSVDPSAVSSCKIKCDIVEKHPDGKGKYIALVENATFVEFC